MRAALRAQRSSLPPDVELALLDAAFFVASDPFELEFDDRPALTPEGAARDLLRWHTLTGLAPDLLADFAVWDADFLSTPAEDIVGFVLLLRHLLPKADLTRVLSALPTLGTLLREDKGEQGTGARLTALRYCAEGALAELRHFMPEAIVQLLVEEEPMLLFGELSIANGVRLRDAWLLSGSAQLSEAELETAMRDERFVRYFTNFIM